ncbi:3539_t:CDS:2, partial [Cetraspora pellucida]
VMMYNAAIAIPGTEGMAYLWEKWCAGIENLYPKHYRSMFQISERLPLLICA